MLCRKSIFFVSLLFGIAVPLAHADLASDYAYGLGSHDTAHECSDPVTTVYPCVSIKSVPYNARTFPSLGSTATLDDDFDYSPSITLSVKYRDPLGPQWRSLGHMPGMKLNFSLDRSGAGMNLDMGGLELNVFLKDDEQQLLETQIFLKFVFFCCDCGSCVRVARYSLIIQFLAAPPEVAVQPNINTAPETFPPCVIPGAGAP